MAYQISDACVCCGACEAQCPVGAISMGDGNFNIPDFFLGKENRSLCGNGHMLTDLQFVVQRIPAECTEGLDHDHRHIILFAKVKAML